MKFVFTLLSLLFLPILSMKEIKPRCCKPFVERAKLKKCTSLIKEQINDVYSLINEFGKNYKEKYNKKCVFNENENENEKENEKEIEKLDFDNNITNLA